MTIKLHSDEFRIYGINDSEDFEDVTKILDSSYFIIWEHIKDMFTDCIRVRPISSRTSLYACLFNLSKDFEFGIE